MGEMGGIQVEGLNANSSKQEQTKTASNRAGDPVAPKAPSALFRMQSALVSPGCLSQEAKAYLDSVVETLKPRFPDLGVHRISSPSYECHVLYTGTHAVALMFVEHYSAADGRPPAAAAPDIRTRFAAAGSKAMIHEVINVTRGMYGRAIRMATSVANMFLSLGDENLANMTAKEFGNDSFAVTCDINKVRAFVESRSPHDVPARDDIGMLIYGLQRKDNQNYSFNAQPEYEMIPIMAVTGYTRFYLTGNTFGMPGAMQTNRAMYTPVTVLTDVVSDLMTAPMLGLGLSVAMDAFIAQFGWTNQFNSYSEADINIGRLTTDPKTGKAWIAKNQQERDTFIQQWLTTNMPFMAIDVQEGRMRNPHLDKLITNPKDILTALQNFNPSAGFSLPAEMIVQARYPQVDGVVAAGSTQQIDSRCIDYLRMAKDIPNTSEIACLLNQSTNSMDSIDQVRKFFPNTTSPQYVTMRCVIHPQFINEVAGAMKNSIHLKYDFMNNNQNYNVGNLFANNGNNYGAFNSFVSSAPNSFNNMGGFGVW